jgi:pyruvate dehydrogenase E2 component (dihydrolipoamide acetyltransferase)
MIVDTVMPQLGLTMTEGSVIRWLKKSGDWVEKGEFLFEIQTDKSDIEVEAPASGYLQVRLEPEKVVPVGTVIARIADSIEELSAADAIASPSSSEIAGSTGGHEAVGAPAPSLGTTAALRERSAAFGDPNHRRVRPTPRARRMAKELGVDISAIEGTGPNGRIVAEDINRIYRQQAPTERYEADLPPSTPPFTAAPILPDRVKASPVRRIIAERMTESFQKTPHFYLNAQADATELVSVKTQLSGEFEDRYGLHVTYTDFLLKALALSVAAHVDMNCFWLNGGISRRNNIDIGFAAQAEDGLLVPVVRNADHLSLVELTEVRSTLTDKARAGRLIPSEMNDASCTLSNLGAFGVDSFNAIINPPESIILAVGRIAKRPWVYNDQLVARFTVSLSLSADHRVTDGVAAAIFLSSIVNYIESPYRLFLPAQQARLSIQV